MQIGGLDFQLESFEKSVIMSFSGFFFAMPSTIPTQMLQRLYSISIWIMPFSLRMDL